VRRRVGFQLLSKEERRLVSRKGGIAAQATGRAHRFTRETAQSAGRLGGRPPNVSDEELGLEPRDESSSGQGSARESSVRGDRG
jgi:hypothetical protein